MDRDKSRKAAIRRKYHVRKKVFGTAERPRLSVYRSNRHMYAQIIDDIAGATLVSASTRRKGVKGNVTYGGNIEAAKKVGEEIAKQALGVGIKCVCFDRNRYKYHGRAKALAEAVLAMYRMPEADRLSMGNRGRKYFEENFKREKLLDRLDIWMTDLRTK